MLQMQITEPLRILYISQCNQIAIPENMSKKSLAFIVSIASAVTEGFPLPAVPLPDLRSKYQSPGSSSEIYNCNIIFEESRMV